METSKLQNLLSNIDTTAPLRKGLSKLESKREDLLKTISYLLEEVTKAQAADASLRDQVVSLYEDLTTKIADKDLIVNVIAKNFSLKPPTQKRAPTINLDSISQDIVDFVSANPEGVPMKALAEKFSDFDRIKFASHVKSLVDNNIISKQGNRNTTKYFPA